MKFSFLAMVASAVVAPVAAQAFTVSASSNIANGGSYSIAGDPFFWGATFAEHDGAGSVSFTFGNAFDADAVLGVTQGTVLQFTGSFNGLTASWGNGEAQSILGSTSQALFSVSTLLDSGSSDVLTISWGDVTGAFAAINLAIASVEAPTPVPLPAGGLLLLSGLAGIGAMRRRAKSKA